MPADVVVAGTAASEIFFETAPTEVPAPLFSSLSVSPSSPVSITPVITPENFHGTVLALLRSARRSIRIEQQYIRGGQPAVEALLKEMDAARQANPALTIRIIVSSKYLAGNNKTRFLQAMKDFGLDFDEHYRFLSRTHFVHCHNKLIVVDDEKVLLGSQNWSTTGLLSNREASLLVEHAGVAGYFAGIFDADWQMSAPDGTSPEAVLAADVDGLSEPADFAKGGVVISSTRDYVDV
jgi:phosphatidylserine/phosphatidylglycerophosphate/cardiolipin synthase-like enzyme